MTTTDDCTNLKINDKTWFRGDEVTITTEPYELHGAMWQDGIDEAGERHTMPTNTQKKINADQAQTEWKEQQAGYARLKNV